MPLVRNAQNAINIGDSFIQRYHFYKTLQSCSRTEAEWVLLYNVGILDEEYVRIRIDLETGEVVEYTNLGAEKP